ncbi:MAG TPA: NAD(P)-dependent oxidoreductase [Bryobacteraceae bacterium]
MNRMPGLGEQLPALTPHEAIVESNRCLFCFDAPCTHACPTHIDIPRFIKKIATQNILGSAKTILEANLLGATCARVCPVQELCEGACVLGSEHKPIMIGRLQRHAMDFAYSRGVPKFHTQAAATGKKIAVIGAGPAGLSCAGELAKRGHAVTLFEKRELGGGLSTYGIISLREPMEVALAEVEMVRGLGVEFRSGVELGNGLSVEDLKTNFDAVFVSAGLGVTPALGIPGEEYILDGLAYIEQSKLDLANLPAGRQVVIIGAGNTAIDCATIAKRQGAEHVTIVYRRTAVEMSAYKHEYDFVKKEGVEFRFLTQPVEVIRDKNGVTGLECVSVVLGELDRSGRPAPQLDLNSRFVLAADQVVKAIGQDKLSVAAVLGVATERGFIQVNSQFETNVPGIYAGGDCIRAKGASSTVMAVQDGKLAAAAINSGLTWRT